MLAGSAVAAKNWFGRAMLRFGLFAARSLSAAEPWRSPFESFLIAYVTEMGWLHKNWPSGGWDAEGVTL